MPTKNPLPPAWELPQEIRSRFGERVGRQRAMVAAGHLLLVLHAPPRADENQRAPRFYWRQPEGTWHSSETSGGASTMIKHLDEYQQLLEKIDRSLDSATLARDYFAVMSHLAPLLRAARNLHKTLQEAREAIASPELITLRDRAYENERMAELLYEDARNGLDFATARRAEQQSEASHRMESAAHRLNLLAAFFFPLATLSSLFGVNMVHGFEQAPGPLPFLIMLSVGLLCGCALTLFVSANKPTAESLARQDPYQKRI
jgi:hypothetical protein